MAASAISSVLQVLNPLILKEAGLLWGVDKEMKKLSSTLSSIQAVLDDAELKQYHQNDIKNWLHKLKDATYEVWNILDDCETEASQRVYEDQIPGALRKVWTCYSLKNLFSRHNIGNRMRNILEDLDSIAQEGVEFHLKVRIPEKFTQFFERSETSSGLTQLEIFGSESDKDHKVEDECWVLFRKLAFGPNNEESPELVTIGKEIVKKCGGVPLAAKALGGLMRSKKGVKEWVKINESELWDIQQGEVPTLPALRLCYHNLPLDLRHCFSYCAVFAKGSRMRKDKLIHLWMANGFISPRGKLEVEDVGAEVWNELHKRSLFLNDENKPEEMFMHDLVHDLARSIIEDECYTMEAESSSIIRPEQNIRHVTLVSNGKRASAFPKSLRGQQKLHSLLLQDRGQDIDSVSECEFSCNFKNFGSLRVFDATRAKMMRLPQSIGNSRHLTYLNLSHTPIKKLPASICSLHHLQTLNLNRCRELQKLPKKMHHLTSLRHVCLLKCYKIEDMPPKLGRLTQLKTLGLFVVGERCGQRVDELQHLDLGGELSIRHLERVHNSMEAKDAKLAGKSKLHVLSLKWEPEVQGNIVEQEELIEALEPHPNIKELTIKGYGGKEMPVWMSDPSVLQNVVSITINNYRNCLGLPALWHLPCLKRLELRFMDEMECVFPNGGSVPSSARVFSSLEELVIVEISNLKGLSMDKEEEGTIQQQKQLFPHLSIMYIFSCPQLALPALPSLTKLWIGSECSSVTLASISKLTSLTSLTLIRNGDMDSFPDEMFQNLTLLQSLHIEYFTVLKVLPENMSSLVALKMLSIQLCAELEGLPDDGIGSLRSLLQLWIIDCPKIVSLPDSIQTLSQLQSLDVWGCSPELQTRFEEGKGQDWFKIEHIPQVTIW